MALGARQGRIEIRIGMMMGALVAVTLAGCGGGGGGGVDPKADMAGSAGCPTGYLAFDGVCVTPPSTKPEAAPQRTQCGDVTEFCDRSNRMQPVLGCLTDAPKMRPPSPAMVTLTGYVHPFSGGTSNAAVGVQVFKADDLANGADITTTKALVQGIFTFDPKTASDGSQFRACDIDPTIGCVPVDPAGCMACNDGLMGRQDDKKYCRAAANGQPATCSGRLRWERRYSLDGVPTNTPLVIRSTGDNYMPSTGVWNTLVAWNVYFATDDKSCSGDKSATDCLDTSDMAKPRYQWNVSVLSQADYTNIPTTAGLSGGITAGQGAIAGEVHDCENIRVANVMVGIKPLGDRLTYFNGDPFKTLPDAGRAQLGTDRLGLYSWLNVAAGKAKIEGVGSVGGTNVGFGKFTAWVYPGVVSVVNLNGGKPVQP
jgi:hypothetical protein